MSSGKESQRVGAAVLKDSLQMRSECYMAIETVPVLQIEAVEQAYMREGGLTQVSCFMLLLDCKSLWAAPRRVIHK